jgi:hypothetical protein
MRVLALAAVCEATLGVALLLDPPIVFRLILGAEASAAGLVMGRVAGIALLALSLACWPERGASDRRPALRGMLAYNALATLYLLYLGIEGEWMGRLLWPAVVLHAVLTGWLLVSIRRREAPTAGPAREASAEAKAAP